MTNPAPRPRRAPTRVSRPPDDQLVRRVIPTVESYFGALIAALLIGLGLIIDHPAPILVGAILTPYMAPVMGLGLATALGNSRLWLQSLFSALLTGGLTLFAGVGLGFFAPQDNPTVALGLSQAHLHAHLSWLNLSIVLLGSGITAWQLGRAETRARVPSIVLAYGIHVPLVVAGYGLTSGISGLWPTAAFTGLALLMTSVLVATGMFMWMGHTPRNTPQTVWAVSLAVGAALVLTLTGIASGLQREQVTMPTPTRTASPTTSPTTPTAAPFTATIQPTEMPTSTPTLVPPTATPTVTFTPTVTASPTLTPRPTVAFIDVTSRARVRAEPEGIILLTLNNRARVEIISTEDVLIDNVRWVQIRTETGVEGWIAASLLTFEDPAP